MSGVSACRSFGRDSFIAGDKDGCLGECGLVILKMESYPCDTGNFVIKVQCNRFKRQRMRRGMMDIAVARIGQVLTLLVVTFRTTFHISWTSRFIPGHQWLFCESVYFDSWMTEDWGVMINSNDGRLIM